MNVGKRSYYIYIVTNAARTVLYTGVTNDLVCRLVEHYKNRGKEKTFAGRYYCYNLLYFEEFKYIKDAISREKEIKGWRREKKEALIKTKNPSWMFLNFSVCEQWPPTEDISR
jgi:putative endonuclease